MKNITVVIPTRNRIEKLRRTLQSIPDLDYVNVVVICDNDRESYDFVSEMGMDTILTHRHIGAVACRNLAIGQCVADGLLYATDDIEFTKDSIQWAFHTFNQNFKDDDGVVGFVQDLSFHPTGVALVGKTFLDRYPDGKLFNPQYWHFACQEILWYCSFLGGRFIQEPRAKIIHYHATMRKGEEADQTHIEARKWKERDLSLKDQRQAAGKVWPVS